MTLGLVLIMIIASSYRLRFDNLARYENFIVESYRVASPTSQKSISDLCRALIIKKSKSRQIPRHSYFRQQKNPAIMRGLGL